MPASLPGTELGPHQDALTCHGARETSEPQVATFVRAATQALRSIGRTASSVGMMEGLALRPFSPAP